MYQNYCHTYGGGEIVWEYEKMASRIADYRNHPYIDLRRRQDGLIPLQLTPDAFDERSQD